MSQIQNIYAFEVIDSRGNPTIQTIVELSSRARGVSSVPSGVSRGTYEAAELRDTDSHRFNGLGVLKAATNINTTIAQKLKGMEATDQKTIDKTLIALDGTQNKIHLGANAILSVSQAVAKAASTELGIPLYQYINSLLATPVPLSFPTPIFNILEGGKHSTRALDIQEILVIPASSKSYPESLEIGLKVYHAAYSLCVEKNFSTLVADEGGFSPALSTNREGLTFVRLAVERAGFNFAYDAFAGIDVAANTLFNGKKYTLKDETTPRGVKEMIEWYQNLYTEYSLVYIEDPFSEDDWEGWKSLYSILFSKVLIVGDDLTVTNPFRLEQALQNSSLNGVVIKPTQIGTIIEAVAVVEMARFKNLKIIVSHRGGETNDDFIADFAIGIGASYCKFGAPARERIAKYNRLRQIFFELYHK